ncbi:MAG: hypothetical protein HQL77_04545 [Magnetococcales bacterium]|nr:hypothetical protein [Magnetococcales bacterium]
MRAKMEECFGPMPEPHGYSDEGEPLYTTAQVAAITDSSVDEVTEQAEELRELCGDTFFHNGPVHRLQ